MLSRLSFQQLPRVLTVCMTVVLLLALMAPAVFADELFSIVPYQEYEFKSNPDDGFSEPKILFDFGFNELGGISSDCVFSVRFDGQNYSIPFSEFHFVEFSGIYLVFAGDCSAYNVIYGEGFFPSTGEPFGLLISSDSFYCVANEYTEDITLDFGLDLVLISPNSAEMFLMTVTTTLASVVGWFGNLIDSFIGADGALSVLFPFVAIGFTIALVYFGVKLVRQFVPGF